MHRANSSKHKKCNPKARRVVTNRADSYLASNWNKFERYAEEGGLPIDNNTAE
jgi:hypothetical protein